MESLITVIIPIYNVEKYLKKCIDSILHQTYQTMEIILIDDESTDESGSICDEYAKKDNRIKVIHKKNGGVSSARNAGLNNANGKYVAFIDADDYIENNMFEKMINQFEKNEKLDIVVCGTKNVDEDGNVLKTSNMKVETIDNVTFLKEILNENKINSVIWDKVFKRDLINKSRFNEKTKISEDLEFVINIIDRINEVEIIPDILYNWLVRKDSATKTKFNDNWKKEIIICENIINLTERKYKELKRVAIKRYIRINITCYKKILDYDKYNKQERKYIRKNIKKYIIPYVFSKYSSIKSKLIAIFICIKII